MTGLKRSFFIVGYNGEGKLHIGHTIRVSLIEDSEIQFRYAYGRNPQETEMFMRKHGMRFTTTEHDLGDSEIATVYWVETSAVDMVRSQDWTEDSMPFFVPFDRIGDQEFWRGLPREIYFQDSTVTANLLRVLDKLLVLEKVG